MANPASEVSIGILLLSSDPQFLKRVSPLLEASTPAVDLLAASSLDEALSMLKEATCDVVLLDASIGARDVRQALSSACSRAVVLLLSSGTACVPLPQGVEDCLEVSSLDSTDWMRRIRYALDRAEWKRRERSSRQTLSPFGSGFFRQVFDLSLQPLLVLEKSQQIVLLNTAASELLETQGNSLVGEVFPFDARVKEKLIIDIPRPNGEVEQMQLEASEFKENGELRILVTLFPLSPSGSLQEALDQEKSRVLQLQAALDDRTGKEAHEGSQENEALQSVGHLVGGIAHDFNNILTAVLGNLSIVRMAMETTHEEAERLTTAEKAVHQAKSLTRQLLTYAKVGALETEATTLEELVSDSAAFILRGSNVAYELTAEPDLWMVDADKGQINQVINNLLINADQAMPMGGMLTLRLENQEMKEGDSATLASGSYVCLEVRDNGAGIPAENLARIFDPYFTTKESGNGLGLASCLAIVRRHGGILTVDSKLGVGSCFRVLLPRSNRAKEETPTDEADESGLPPKGSGRILIMDDMEPMKLVAGEILTLLGYEVHLTSDGLEAIEAYREAMKAGRPFRAVVFDLTVPGGMGGEEACRQLRADDPKLRAIASSGYSTSNVMSDWNAHGFDAVIAKPYRIKDIGWILHRVLQPPAGEAPAS
tara:strand:+ start:5453 stop:7417 length:1965 start_codon:yes stop_codon:yes gene_type:complete